MKKTMTIFNKLIIKTKNSSGETLAETLVGLLIAALATAMLASMITASKRMITNSMSTMKEFYSGENILVSQNASAVPAYVSTASGDVLVKDESENSYQIIPGLSSFKVNYYVNNRIKKTPSLSYKKQ